MSDSIKLSYVDLDNTTPKCLDKSILTGTLDIAQICPQAEFKLVIT